jgi:hypothetical protein
VYEGRSPKGRRGAAAHAVELAPESCDPKGARGSTALVAGKVCVLACVVMDFPGSANALEIR